MIENVPEIPCLFDRKEFCPEFSCPLNRINEKHIIKVLWKIRSREWAGLRNSFQRQNIDITGEMICNLLSHPNDYTKSDGSYLWGTKFTAENKKFGDYLANIRRAWIDKYDNPWDAYEVKCLVKRQRLYSHR